MPLTDEQKLKAIDRFITAEPATTGVDTTIVETPMSEREFQKLRTIDRFLPEGDILSEQKGSLTEGAFNLFANILRPELSAWNFIVRLSTETYKEWGRGQQPEYDPVTEEFALRTPQEQIQSISNVFKKSLQSAKGAWDDDMHVERLGSVFDELGVASKSMTLDEVDEKVTKALMETRPGTPGFATLGGLKFMLPFISTDGETVSTNDLAGIITEMRIPLVLLQSIKLFPKNIERVRSTVDMFRGKPGMIRQAGVQLSENIKHAHPNVSAMDEVVRANMSPEMGLRLEAVSRFVDDIAESPFLRGPARLNIRTKANRDEIIRGLQNLNKTADDVSKGRIPQKPPEPAVMPKKEPDPPRKPQPESEPMSQAIRKMREPVEKELGGLGIPREQLRGMTIDELADLAVERGVRLPEAPLSKAPKSVLDDLVKKNRISRDEADKLARGRGEANQQTVKNAVTKRFSELSAEETKYLYDAKQYQSFNEWIVGQGIDVNAGYANPWRAKNPNALRLIESIRKGEDTRLLGQRIERWEMEQMLKDRSTFASDILPQEEVTRFARNHSFKIGENTNIGDRPITVIAKDTDDLADLVNAKSRAELLSAMSFDYVGDAVKPETARQMFNLSKEVVEVPPIKPHRPEVVHGQPSTSPTMPRDPVPSAPTSIKGVQPKTEQVVEGFRGHGRPDPESVYSIPEVGPIFGKAEYFAPSEKIARDFGPNVTKAFAEIDNPLVISSDDVWRALTREAGWKHPNPVRLDKTPETIRIMKQEVDSMRKLIESKGHDSVVIKLAPDDRTKTLRKVFGTDQMVVFDKGKLISSKDITKPTPVPRLSTDTIPLGEQKEHILKALEDARAGRPGNYVFDDGKLVIESPIGTEYRLNPDKVSDHIANFRKHFPTRISNKEELRRVVDSHLEGKLKGTTRMSKIDPDEAFRVTYDQAKPSPKNLIFDDGIDRVIFKGKLGERTFYTNKGYLMFDQVSPDAKKYARETRTIDKVTDEIRELSKVSDKEARPLVGLSHPSKDKQFSQVVFEITGEEPLSVPATQYRHIRETFPKAELRVQNYKDKRALQFVEDNQIKGVVVGNKDMDGTRLYEYLAGGVEDTIVEIPRQSQLFGKSIWQESSESLAKTFKGLGYPVELTDRMGIDPTMGLIGGLSGFGVTEEGEITGDFDPKLAALGMLAGGIFGGFLRRNKRFQKATEKIMHNPRKLAEMKQKQDYAAKLFKGREVTKLPEFKKLSKENRDLVAGHDTAQWTRREIDMLNQTSDIPSSVIERLPIEDLSPMRLPALNMIKNTPEEALSVYEKAVLSPVSAHPSDIASSKYLRTNTLSDYQREIFVQPPGDKFIDDILSGNITNFYKHYEPFRGFLMMGSGHADSLPRKLFYDSMAKTTLARWQWIDNKMKELDTIRGNIHKRTAADQVSTRLAEMITSSDLQRGITFREVIGKQGASDILARFKPQQQEEIAKFALEGRRMFRDLLDLRNSVRAKIGLKPVNEIDNYVTKMRDEMFAARARPADSFRDADWYLEPRRKVDFTELQRKGDIPFEERNMNLIDLLERYVNISAADDIFLNPWVANTRQYIRLMEGVGLPKGKSLPVPLDNMPVRIPKNLHSKLSYDKQSKRLTFKEELNQNEFNYLTSLSDDDAYRKALSQGHRLSRAQPLEESARYTKEWVNEAFLGKRPKLDMALSAGTFYKLPEYSSTFSNYFNKTIFPAYYAWTAMTQLSTGVQIPALYGARSSIKGGLRYFTDKKFRNAVQHMYSSQVKGMKYGSVAFQDVGQQAREVARLDKKLTERASDLMSLQIRWTEKQLSLLSNSAGVQFWLDKGFPMKDAFRLGGDSAFLTQSAYDMVNVVPFQRNKIVPGLIKFQNFSWTWYNNMRMVGKIEGFRERKLKTWAGIMGAAAAWNVFSSYVRGYSPWAHDSFIPYYNNPITGPAADQVIERAMSKILGERAPSQFRAYTRNLPTPTSLMMDAGDAAWDIYDAGSYERFRRFAVRYGIGAKPFKIPGGLAASHFVEGLVAVGRDGDVYDRRGDPQFSFDVDDPEELLRAIFTGPHGTKEAIRLRREQKRQGYVDRIITRALGLGEPDTAQPQRIPEGLFE